MPSFNHKIDGSLVISLALTLSSLYGFNGNATNKDFLQEVKAGRFREDFYCRLNVILIDLPMLPRRRNDISLLARYFLKQFATLINLKNTKSPNLPSISPHEFEPSHFLQIPMPSV